MLDFLFATAQAQETANQNPISSFAPLIIVFLIFYFLVLRPQSKKIKQEQALLSTLNKGDEVFTKAGILGTISGLTEKVVTLEVSDGVKLKVLRSQVAGFSKKLFESSKDDKKG